MITHGIGDTTFVTTSVRNLEDAANALAREIQSIQKHTSAMQWQGPDRVDFDKKKDTLVGELRLLEEVIRAKSVELNDILEAQRVASGEPSRATPGGGRVI